ncbi:extracellular solute-binding protein [Cohnella fermenti]|uniref:Extracellular solute-binding protein n=1 Tax=Cohnella fermenti TaxID=2565925 RepID=A0A4S4BIZ3_9BACL|nr:extracellular solute-binding protein [Cohnella fermenti]THF73598.1 extracellular solute-binding protein [Cohnella fermenti]
MINRIKKGMGATTGIVMAAALVTGCSGSGDEGSSSTASNAGATATSSERPTISVIKPLYSSHVYFPDSGLEKIIEDELNINLQYETPPSGDYKTVLNVKLAGGDIPDIVATMSPGDSEHNALISQGVFLPLDDYLEKFPKLKESFSEEIWDLMRSPTDGKIYGVPWLRDRGGSGIFIRKDWLDKLGLSEPKTLDELYDVLVAFRDKDPDGNGAKDTIPLAFRDNNLSTIYPFVTLFGGNPGWYPESSDPNKLVFGQVQPEMAEMLAYLNTLRQEGLIDPDLLIGNTLGLDKFKAGTAGVLVGTLGDFRQMVESTTMKAVILDPITNGDQVWKLALPALPVSRTNQISAKSQNPEAALRYLEYQVTDGFDYIQYGVEGKTYSVENGVKIPFAEDKKDNNYNTTTGLELLQPEWLFSDTEKFTKFVSVDSANYMLGKIDNYEKNIAFDYLRTNIVFPYRNEVWSQLDTILKEGYTKMIVDKNADPMAIFEETVEKWKAAGGTKVIDEANELQEDKSAPTYRYQKK